MSSASAGGCSGGKGDFVRYVSTYWAYRQPQPRVVVKPWMCNVVGVWGTVHRVVFSTVPRSRDSKDFLLMLLMAAPSGMSQSTQPTVVSAG